MKLTLVPKIFCVLSGGDFSVLPLPCISGAASHFSNLPEYKHFLFILPLPSFFPFVFVFLCASPYEGCFFSFVKQICRGSAAVTASAEPLFQFLFSGNERERFQKVGRGQLLLNKTVTQLNG